MIETEVGLLGMLTDDAKQELSLPVDARQVGGDTGQVNINSHSGMLYLLPSQTHA